MFKVNIAARTRYHLSEVIRISVRFSGTSPRAVAETYFILVETVFSPILG